MNETEKMMEKTALIIESIKPIGILIEDFLKRLGISEVQQVHYGIDGEKKFMDMLKTENLPLVFVDYNLPDIECFILLLNILSVESRTKIILTTNRERTDDSIKYIIGLGVKDICYNR